MDRNSPKMVSDYVKELSNAQSVDEDCEKYLACGLPISHVRILQIL